MEGEGGMEHGGAATAMEGVTPATGGAQAAPEGGKKARKPVVCLFMGMAGSGKTTLVQRLNLYLNEKVR